MQPVISCAEDHLRYIRRLTARLMEVNDKMFGTSPKDPIKEPGNEAPYYSHMSALQTLSTETGYALNHLENELDRLENGLYLADGKAALGMPAATISRSGY